MVRTVAMNMSKTDMNILNGNIQRTRNFLGFLSDKIFYVIFILCFKFKFKIVGILYRLSYKRESGNLYGGR